jgi:hypothetical protein
MSTQIDVARVLQFKSNLQMLSQQKGSRLRGAVRTETVVGKSAFFDLLGAATAVIKSGRHSDTPQIDSAHSRRKVDLNDYHWADMIDDQDKIRMLIDPTSEYAMAAAYALGRSMDDVILAAAVGNAYSGESGATVTALGTAQRVVPVSGAAQVNLSLGALQAAKMILDAADVDPSIPRYIAINASALQSLLGDTKVTSSDFASVKALVQGELDTYMGFKFIRTERVNQISPLAFTFDTTSGLYNGGGTSLSGTTKSMVAWAGDGLGLAMGKDIEVKIDPRADKSYATQVYARSSFGATRIEDAKVVEILCKQ